MELFQVSVEFARHVIGGRQHEFGEGESVRSKLPRGMVSGNSRGKPSGRTREGEGGEVRTFDEPEGD